ncbi:hypothetical protein [Natronolimnobius baerhuensis]|uniref:Uncharacterized protein n=1 Tax=Natronolimnobius baerhuensis TaxID=253108 RepID=A0A202EC18_9EURY|nr:hypothetical protein [Natronolimnobius baerhuensis]OVE85738.1 hypothetical protein B2G88_02675 [Natronolimnobius baerhuensis]
MGPLDRVEDEYVDVSSRRATVRELLELAAGALVFVLVASALAYYLLGHTVALVVAAALVLIFGVMLISQTYWAITGRSDYE